MENIINEVMENVTENTEEVVNEAVETEVPTNKEELFAFLAGAGVGVAFAFGSKFVIRKSKEAAGKAVGWVKSKAGKDAPNEEEVVTEDNKSEDTTK